MKFLMPVVQSNLISTFVAEPEIIQTQKYFFRVEQSNEITSERLKIFVLSLSSDLV